MIDIFYNEWRGLLRNKLFLFIILFFVLSLSVVTFFGVVQNNKQIQSQKEAHDHIRSQWDEMDPSNPHSAAHFGTYAFKPNSIESWSSLSKRYNEESAILSPKPS